jgi:dTDP-4-dehydrorhamnose reductase
VFPGTEEDHQKYPKGYSEDHPTNPINTYGESKLAGEQAVRESGCEFIIMRVAWLCGKHGSNFVKTMLKMGKEREEVSVVNDQFGCPSFAHNVVYNCWKLVVEHKLGTYHLCSEGKISWHEFAKEIFEQMEIPVNLKPVSSSEFPAKAKRPAFSLLNTQKISNIPGVTIIDWKEGLTNLLAELRS